MANEGYDKSIDYCEPGTEQNAIDFLQRKNNRKSRK
jgi:hypothetical protein